MQACKLLCSIFRSSLQTDVFIQRLLFSLCICVLMDEMLVSKGCSSTTVSTEPSFYPPSPLYPLWPCNPMRWMQIDWPITHTHLCRQGSPLNPWDSAMCDFVHVRAHGLTPAARLDVLNTATNRQTKVWVIAHSADSFPAPRQPSAVEKPDRQLQHHRKQASLHLNVSLYHVFAIKMQQCSFWGQGEGTNCRN